MGSLSQQLADICLRPVDAGARERARLHLLDWLGCAAIGAAQPEAAALLAGSALPGSPGESDPWHSLMFAASVANIMEMDDIHRDAIVHPGPVVIPAALFLAHRLERSTGEILDAIVRGYEAMTRLGASVGSGHYRYWHNTATCGPVGAAAAACSLLGLNARQWTHAFAHAATQSAGLWQVRLEPGVSKQWHVSRAAQTGVQAALLAHAGGAGPERIFEGEKGFHAAMCPDGDAARLTADPTGPWRLFSTSFKPWPACRHAHAGIDAALALRAQPAFADITPASVARIDVESYGDALAFCDCAEPLTGLQARFSLQHAVAVCLCHGPPRLEHFHASQLQAADVAAWRQKVRVCATAHWSNRYPEHYGAGITLHLIDGTSLSATIDDALGDPERPLAPDDIQRKAIQLLDAAGWPAATRDAAIHACLDDEATESPAGLCRQVAAMASRQHNIPLA